jgi:thiamine-phosphate pyrophosphorylase
MADSMSILPPLYAIINADTHPSPVEYCRQLLICGVQLIQLRAKTFLPEQMLAFTVQTLQARDELLPSARILVNDSPDVCLQSGADGLHLGQDDMPPAAARRLLGADKLIGFSTHSLEQLAAAPSAMLDYLALGPIFPSRTKSGHAPAVGISVLTAAARMSPLPLVAIGGIDAENIGDIYAAGAASAAVIADLQEATDLQTRVSRYLAASQAAVLGKKSTPG